MKAAGLACAALLACAFARPAAAEVCNKPGNMPRISASGLEFGRVPGLSGAPVRSAMTVHVACPRAGDTLPPFRVMLLSAGGTAMLAGPGGAALPLALRGLAGDDTMGGATLFRQAAASHGRAAFTIDGALFRDARIAAGLYAGTVTLQLRLD
ncbi:hypothetical protein [Falsiroseomonas ponticola]|jgi:hypothetical protein|uniref:hypothetical protein n=1 Tax=Falsiroseomonas ponticola TaxID=2786951 RepID=UPI0019322253|nr:hypothetical protein [Roseomonas ponticola]